jgi:GNAT superfamily N-acetyltransferase
MKMNAIKAAPAASAIALKNEKSAKAKRILIGTDVHLRGYQAARKVDNGVIGVVIQPGRDQRQIIAVARLIKAHCANEAELAISDDWQDKGLGTKLLGDLLTIGRTEGLERIVGYILPENYVMQRISG